MKLFNNFVAISNSILWIDIKGAKIKSKNFDSMSYEQENEFKYKNVEVNNQIKVGLQVFVVVILF